MKKTLRRKFVFFAMAAVTLLLLVLLISINGLTWIQFEREANEVLDTLVNTDGLFMKQQFRKEDNNNNFLLPPEIDIMRSARFFMVKTDPDGKFLSCDLNQIFYVSDDDAADYAKKVLSKNALSGRIDRYKYRIKKNDLSQNIFFLDMTRERLTINTVLYISVLIAVGSWLISFVFVLIFSAWFVRPIVAGIEKQKQFITNAGHELKTPLAIIQSNNDAMTLIHGENKYNRNIKAQVTRLGELTANLLTQARLDEEVELKKEHINISMLTNELLQPYKDSAETRNITLVSDVRQGLILNTNRQSFTQLITLLMDNAIKYTTDGGDVSFTLSRDNKNILITEENSCDPEMNIDPERLFERFYRADSARTQSDQHSGYGIGLSAARSICEALGGKLTASYPKQGRISFTAKF